MITTTLDMMKRTAAAKNGGTSPEIKKMIITTIGLKGGRKTKQSASQHRRKPVPDVNKNSLINDSEHMYRFTMCMGKPTPPNTNQITSLIKVCMGIPIHPSKIQSIKY